MTTTLSFYVARRLASAVLVLVLVLGALIVLVDLIESLRFAAKFEGGFGFALRLTLFRAPGLCETLLPFVFLFAPLWTFSQLNRRSELSVMRAAGASVWRIVAPAAVLASMLGVLVILVLNPVATQLAEQAEIAKNDLRGRSASFLKVFRDGVWMRQRDEDATLLLNARRFDSASGVLGDVALYRLGPDGVLLERIDASSAVFAGRTIELREAILRGPKAGPTQRTPLYAIPTGLTLRDLRAGAPRPDTMSIWDLPRFVAVAEAAGLPTDRYQLRFHDILATPAKFMAMVLIAAAFTQRPARSGGGALSVLLAAVAAGFTLYILNEISVALAETGAASPVLAAWTPVALALIAASFLLMKAEET